MTILGRSEELVSRCVECDLAEPESLASLGGSAPGVVDGILSQIAQLAGPPMKWYVSTDGKSLIGDYMASRYLVDPEKALSGFVDKNKKKLYEKMHGRYVARKLLVREMHDDETEQVLMRQVIDLPFPCET